MNTVERKQQIYLLWSVWVINIHNSYAAWDNIKWNLWKLFEKTLNIKKIKKIPIQNDFFPFSKRSCKFFFFWKVIYKNKFFENLSIKTTFFKIFL